ncbi:hypothetical protein AXF42_Ash001412 [Apostasia shenzhenica]|uniref:Uncharacterized protein n=1 Tax=Apostasia shenzhenica TaxID=1088818 RepID=A0A2I0AUU8_9ASPA|nr:hypothetical protein AXF42_Ash001412 [Apostasia shenzhenica]
MEVFLLKQIAVHESSCPFPLGQLGSSITLVNDRHESIFSKPLLNWHKGRERDRERERASRVEGVGNSYYRLSKIPWEHKEAIDFEITSSSYHE